MIWLAFKIGRFLDLDKLRFVPAWAQSQTLIHVEIVMRFPCTGNVRTCVACAECMPRVLHPPVGNMHLISFSATEEQGVFRTVDADKFTSSGHKWLFLSIANNVPHFIRGFQFCQQQLNKPLNFNGARLEYMWCCCGKYRPHGARRTQSLSAITSQPSWFCSELVSAYLIAAGLEYAVHLDPCEYTPAMLYREVLHRVESASETTLNPYVHRASMYVSTYAPELTLTPMHWRHARRGSVTIMV